ncbi:hypothetical protein AHAS_Ahas19G0084500 [Arachis hypogaea]
MNLSDEYNSIVEFFLWVTKFYHISQIVMIQIQSILVTVLVKRWHPDIHTFNLLIDECTVTLKDMAQILGIMIDGLLVTETTITNFEVRKLR